MSNALSSDGGHFGIWAEDADGHPCFDLDIDDQRGDLVLPSGGPGAVWHQLGSSSFTALAHADGSITLYTARGGFVRVARSECPWTKKEARARWGEGYAEWVGNVDETHMERRTWVFPDVPSALIVEATFPSGEQEGVLNLERWWFAPCPLVPGPAMSHRVDPPEDYTGFRRAAWRLMFAASGAARFVTERARRALGRAFGLHVKEGGSEHVVLATRFLSSIRRRSLVPRLLEDVFVVPLAGPRVVEAEQTRGDVEVTVKRSVGQHDGMLSYTYAVGLAPRNGAGRAIDEVRKAYARDSHAPTRPDIPILPADSHPLLSREASWHAYYLCSAAVYDESFGCLYVPQGSAYGYIHGLQGAPRDYALTAAVMSHTRPVVARDMLKLMMMMTTPDGTICYGHAGAGACLPGVIHKAPTDLPLFFLWALVEYVAATGDAAILDDEVLYYPQKGARTASSTIRERVLLEWRYIKDFIGRGEHGMIRAGSGDWSDPLALMVDNPGLFRLRGESGFNTAMGAYVLPLVANLVESTEPLEASDMRTYARLLSMAMESAWAGRWFLRGWDGGGDPIGADHLFLDGQAWCLIAGLGSDAQRATLIDAIEELCAAPSPIGPAILDRPHDVRLGILEPGTDCNGGVWAAINGLLAWGYALHDVVLAWRCLESQSMAAHARAYPGIWYGIWSGPDAFNSWYAACPGETFVHPATPMREFPIMNSNAHAGPLLGLLKTLEAEERA